MKRGVHEAPALPLPPSAQALAGVLCALRQAHRVIAIRTFLLVALGLSPVLVLGVAAQRSPADDSPPLVVTVDRVVDGRNVDEWRTEADRWHRVAARYRRQSRLHWEPTVEYAYTLASAIYGVPRWELHAVGSCESKHYPFARNGRYLGVMQLGWRPFGLSPFDPVANVLSAAATVRHDGSWRQWECKP